MAPSAAKAQSGFEPAEGACSGDDWVSLILSDVGLDGEAHNSVSLASLADFPLPDLDDMDLSNFDGSASNHDFTSSFEKGHSSADLLFDPSKMLQDMEICPSLYGSGNQDASEGQVNACAFPLHPEGAVCTSLSHFTTSLKENVGLESPKSGLTCVNSDAPDADRSIPALDSGSDEDSFYFLVSDICSEGTANTEIEHDNSANVANTTSQGNSGKNLGSNMEILQSSRSQQKFSSCSENSGNSRSIGNTSRKRKHLDQMSISSTPEEMAADCSEKVGNSMEGESKDEEEERRQARLMRNRESAQLSRQRKKVYVDELEEKIKTMASTIAELNNTINLISAENINLRRQLGLFGPPPVQAGAMANVAPWMAAYPPGHMMTNRFIVPGAQVPLVPIPKWKSQQASPVKKTKNVTSKRTKKVAGIAAAGLFFFMFILLPINFQFLGLGPILQKESRVWPTAPLHGQTRDVVMRAGARVLTGLNEERDLSQNERGTHTRFASPGGYLNVGDEYWDARRASQVPISNTCDTAETRRKDHSSAFEMNGSVPLAAALFVPKNDGLVRIEGNLIIHSVLAGDKAAECLNRTNKQNVRTPALRDRGSALRANLKALAVKAAPEERGALVDLQRALAAKMRFDLDGVDMKSLKEDGSLQQWFLEDFTGPVFSSGMCTEVFQFEMSPAASPSSPGSGPHVGDANDIVNNKSAWLQGNAPRKAGRSVSHSGKSPSYAVPLPPVGHKVVYNATSKNGSFVGMKGGYGADKEFAKQKHGSSSVVVSLLAGPEFGEQSKLSGGNGLSRIFVVVLIDSVKYVTYSCMLPSSYEVVVA